MSFHWCHHLVLPYRKGPDTLPDEEAVVAHVQYKQFREGDPRSGALMVYVGPMYSGKSDALISAIQRFEDQGMKAGAFRPCKDSRDDEDHLVSRTGRRFPALRVVQARDAMKHIPEDMDVVAFDEPHMFQGDFVQTCLELKLSGLLVLVAGLNLDYRGLPLKPMPRLLCYADQVVRLDAAYCSSCGYTPALYSRRLVDDETLVLPGGKGAYDALCAACWLEDRHASDEPADRSPGHRLLWPGRE